MSKLFLLVWSIFSLSCAGANDKEKNNTVAETQQMPSKKEVSKKDDMQRIDGVLIVEKVPKTIPSTKKIENKTSDLSTEIVKKEVVEVSTKTTASKKKTEEKTTALSTEKVKNEVVEVSTKTTPSQKKIEEKTTDLYTEEVKNEVVEVSTKTHPAKEKSAPVISKEKTEVWNQLLIKHVNNDGDVNYKGFLNDKEKLQAYLDDLAVNSPQTGWSKKEKLVYYINIYNAGTVMLILNNYPTKSIKDINKPWGKKIVKIGEETFSLGDIEHKILRKMNEPRIHFAINCASYSCPKLINKAFTVSNVEKMLEAATIDFISDSKRNKITADRLELSNIFKWYKKDFTTNGSLIDYINRYLENKIDTKSAISFLKYDWSLNEAK